MTRHEGWRTGRRRLWSRSWALHSLPVSGLLVSLLVALWLALPVAADPRELYKQGIEALEAGRWVDAERFFRAAIEERPEERYNPLFGRRYFPHYQLGLALAEQGDCRAALDAWQVSKRQGKIEKDDDLVAEMERRSQGCRDRLARLDEVSGEVEERFSETDDRFATLAGLADKPALARSWQATGGFGEREQRARRQVEQMRQQATAARQRQDLARLETVRDEVSSFADDLAGLIAEARTELGELNAATASALGELESETSRARRLLGSVRRLEPYPPELTRRVRAVQQLLGEVEQLGERARPQQLRDVEQRLQAANFSLRRASAGPPEALTTALEAHLAGDPRGVLDSLEAGEPFDDPRARSHACLLRAAALHLRHASESVRPLVEPEEIEEPVETDLLDPTTADVPPLDGASEDRIAAAGDDPPDEVSLDEVSLDEDSLDEGFLDEGPLEETELEPPVTEDDMLQALRACVGLDPEIVPSRRFFSPRFIELYHRLRGEVALAEEQDAPASE